jgi:hypothetical protein
LGGGGAVAGDAGQAWQAGKVKRVSLSERSRSRRGTEVAALFYSLIESAKLAGVVHTVRYSGVLAPASKWRPLI